MNRQALFSFVVLALTGMTACTPTWNHDGGARTLPASYVSLASTTAAPLKVEIAPSNDDGTVHSRPVFFVIPDGWHWFVRGDDLIATRDGVFLQQIFIERIHVDQVDQTVTGAFPLAALSTKQWPVRTVKSMTKRFAAGMSPADAAEILLESRRNDQGITDVQVLTVATRTIAGQPAFRALFEFRLKGPAELPLPLYRSIYCGFMFGDWFYGISYTAAARYYFDRDAGTFEMLLENIRIVDK
jgi:hypothetical protein